MTTIELPQVDAAKLSAELFAAVEAANEDEINRINAEQEKIVQFLKVAEEQGADPSTDFDEEKLDIVNKTREDGKTPLLLAVDKGNVAILKALLKSSAINVQIADKNGCIALHNAVRLGKYDIAEALLQTEPNMQLTYPCSTAPFTSYTAMHFACSYAAAEKQMDKIMLLFLDKYNANIDTQTADGDTPLHVATQCSSYMCAMHLLDHGASVTMKNKAGRTPIMIASGLANEEMLRLLLRNIKSVDDLNITDRLGDTAFHFSFQSQLQRVFKEGYELTFQNDSCAYVLARTGINIDHKCNEGYMGTDFCSDSLAVILRTVQKYPNLLPPTLQQLIAARLNSMATMESSDRLAFETALHDYKKEREAIDAASAAMGSCPVNKGNPHLKRKTEGIVESPAVMQHGYGATAKKPSAPPAALMQLFGGMKPKDKEPKAEEEEAEEDNSKKKKKNKKNSKKPKKPESDCPFGYVGELEDAKRKKEAENSDDDDDFKHLEDEDAEADADDSDEDDSDDESEDYEARAAENCPVPFATKLMFIFTKNFWIGVAFGVAVTKLSQRFTFSFRRK